MLLDEKWRNRDKPTTDTGRYIEFFVSGITHDKRQYHLSRIFSPKNQGGRYVALIQKLKDELAVYLRPASWHKEQCKRVGSIPKAIASSIEPWLTNGILGKIEVINPGREKAFGRDNVLAVRLRIHYDKEALMEELDIPAESDAGVISVVVKKEDEVSTWLESPTDWEGEAIAISLDDFEVPEDWQELQGFGDTVVPEPKEEAAEAVDGLIAPAIDAPEKEAKATAKGPFRDKNGKFISRAKWEGENNRRAGILDVVAEVAETLAEVAAAAAPMGTVVPVGLPAEAEPELEQTATEEPTIEWLAMTEALRETPGHLQRHITRNVPEWETPEMRAVRGPLFGECTQEGCRPCARAYVRYAELYAQEQRRRQTIAQTTDVAQEVQEAVATARETIAEARTLRTGNVDNDLVRRLNERAERIAAQRRENRNTGW